MEMKLKTLMNVLSKMLGKKIIHAVYETKQLHNTGKVQLVTGIAETDVGEKLPYNIILKIQKKREYLGDPDLWRREYDLYAADLKKIFSDSLLMPDCYHAEMNADETEMQMWTEYIDGISGDGLTIEMLEFSAAELGRFQGRIYKQQPQSLKNIPCITKTKREETKEYRYIRSNDCAIPKDLRQIIINNYVEMARIIKNNELPVVLCKGDVWAYNMIYSDGKILHLDWENANWGYICEDIMGLVSNEIVPYSFEPFKIKTEKLEKYYHRLIGAYLKGFLEYADISQMNYSAIWKLFVTKFGYKVISWYLSTATEESKQQHIDELYKIYELKEIRL